jgi:hypothetical protein
MLFSKIAQIQGIFHIQYFVQHCFICRTSDSTASEEAGIEPRMVATLALAARRSITTRLDLIHSRLDLIHRSAISSTTRLDLIHALLDLIHALLDLLHTRLDLIHNSARSPAQLGWISSTTRLDFIHIEFFLSCRLR